ncbi:MAG TPA: hypothetical protein VI423_07485 [Paenisporosarcina sp.]|nr:hypothetical protein [Paenisporosarcina sp.]
MGLQDEVKSLLIIGGLPSLGCCFGFVLALLVFPDDGFKGLILTATVAMAATMYSTYLMIMRIFAVLRKRKRNAIRTYFDMEWP